MRSLVVTLSFFLQAATPSPQCSICCHLDDIIFPAKGYVLSRAWLTTGLHHFPLTRSYNFSRACQELHLFARLPRETTFAAIFQWFVFSRACHTLHVFPFNLELVFSRLRVAMASSDICLSRVTFCFEF